MYTWAKERLKLIRAMQFSTSLSDEAVKKQYLKIGGKLKKEKNVKSAAVALQKEKLKTEPKNEDT